MQSTRVQLTWRPITTADAGAWAALLGAAEAVDATGEHYDADDLMEELADPALDAERDSIAGFADGEMVAYGLIRGATEIRDVYRVHAEGCVRPDHRRAGLGGEVLAFTAARAREVHQRQHSDRPGELLVYGHDSNAGLGALVHGFGMRPARYWFDMHRSLAEPPPPRAPVADGLRIVEFEPTMDGAVRLARNEAFADHWGSVDRDEVSWKQWFTGSRAFRPALSFAVLDGSEVAGILLSYEYPADTAGSGVRDAWIGQLGTRRSWRGRGVATALISTALASYAAAGFERAALTVDTGNPTGALGLYERAGFTVSQRWTTYSRPL